MPSFTGAEFYRCPVQLVPNFVGAEFGQRVQSLTDADDWWVYRVPSSPAFLHIPLRIMFSHVRFQPIRWQLISGINVSTHPSWLQLSYIFYAPLEKGGTLFCNCLSVCRLSVVRSISFDPFNWSIPNLV